MPTRHSAPASRQPPSVHKHLQQIHTWSSGGHSVKLLCSSSAAHQFCSSVGARCDWFVQLQVQRRRAELQATVAGLTDAAGLKQLLAWHWDLLVAAAGAEHVTTVPAVGRRQVTTAPSHTLQPPCSSFTPFTAHKSSPGILPFKHEHHRHRPGVTST